MIPTTRYFRHQHLRGRADCLGRNMKLTSRLGAVHLQRFFLHLLYIHIFMVCCLDTGRVY